MFYGYLYWLFLKYTTPYLSLFIEIFSKVVITERQDGLLIVGTEGRALEVDFEHGQQTANQGDISYHKSDAMESTFVVLHASVISSHNLRCKEPVILPGIRKHSKN